MKITAAFGIFITAVLFCIKFKMSVIFALLVGMICFFLVGINLKFTFKQVLFMCFEGIGSTIAVIEVMCVIGLITAVWRASGTITVFAYYGTRLIIPELFLLITFFVTCLLSYALGTSFGVAGTVGVIFMTLAESGGVNPVITAGVIMSGVYFGDRCSPMSSGANMVSAMTGTDLYGNVRLMMKTSIAPMLITTAIYSVLSVTNPLEHVDEEIINAFASLFSLSAWSMIPAVIMLLLPLLKVNVIKSMAASVLSGIVIAMFVEGVSVQEVIEFAIFGYKTDGEGAGQILNGGGLLSMLEVIGILMVSGAYSGIFSGTKMFSQIEEKLENMCRDRGRYFVMLCMSIITSIVFSIQAIAAMMCMDLMRKPYQATGGTDKELAIDIENSVMMISCIIPWGVGCTVPLAFMGADMSALPYAVYMYLLPVVYLFTKSRILNLRHAN